MVPWVGMQCVIVVFPDLTHLLLNEGLLIKMARLKFQRK